MKPSTRRNVLRSTTGIVSFGLAGCIEFTRHQAVHLQLVNGRQEDHTVTISVEDEDFEESLFVEGAGYVYVADFLEPGRYELAVELDEGESTEYTLPMDCEELVLSVTIDHPEGFRIEYWCHTHGEFTPRRSSE